MQIGPSEDTDEVNNDAMLGMVNANMASLGSTSKWLRLPEMPEGVEVLHGKRVLFVDDVSRLLESFVPHLTVATQGGASFMLHRPDQSAWGLAWAIIAADPDILLLDANLANDVKGWDVAGILLHQEPSMRIIGFSSDAECNNRFLRAGAEGAVTKEPGYPEVSLTALIAHLQSR